MERAQGGHQNTCAVEPSGRLPGGALREGHGQKGVRESFLPPTAPPSRHPLTLPSLLMPRVSSLSLPQGQEARGGQLCLLTQPHAAQ